MEFSINKKLTNRRNRVRIKRKKRFLEKFEKYLKGSWKLYCKSYGIPPIKKTSDEIFKAALKKKREAFRMSTIGFFRKELKRQIKKNNERIFRLQWTPTQIKNKTLQVVARFRKRYLRRAAQRQGLRKVTLFEIPKKDYYFQMNKRLSGFFWIKRKSCLISRRIKKRKKLKVKDKILKKHGIKRRIVYCIALCVLRDFARRL
jgi:hypothetical protein